jgi:ATP-dependent RNA helicase RhlE
LTTFSQLGLNAALLKSLEAEGYTTPTPIQAQAIPHVLAGKDLLGIAQTGTGKTAAFALPILHRLAADRRPALRLGARTLVLSPTRELATQIAQSFKTYGRHMNLTVALMYGGVPHRPQVTAVSRGVDILVATPGRLIQHIEERSVVLSGTEILVLDEADQMLDMGFIRPIRQILSRISAKRQSLFFSATMPKEIGALAAEMLRNPERVAVAPAATMVDRVRQSVIHVEPQRKQSLLVELFADPAMRRTLVFTRTKRGADKVARHLEAAGIKVAAIHGNKSQGAREAALHAFRAGRIRGLIATDIAARGIDIDEVTHVVNFDLPHVPESYVHRIGRTARAGADGIAISLCGREERPLLRDIERLTRQSIASIDRSNGGEEPTSNRHGLVERRGGPPAKFRNAHNGKRQTASTSKQQRRHRGAAFAR